MQKFKAKALAVTIILSVIFAILYPSVVNASTGWVLINTTTSPSIPGQPIIAGSNVNLYFKQVTWSGGQFYLLISQDGFSQVSEGDNRYTVVFEQADLARNATATYSGSATYPGSWSVGYGWVNGTIAKNIAEGKYYIKAFDGAATSVAVTDAYIQAIAALEVTPASGPAGTPVTIKGYASAANALVSLSYLNPISNTWVLITDSIQTGNLGQFTYNLAMPDLKQANPPNDNAGQSDIIKLRAIETATGNEYQAEFTELKRGLMQVGTQYATDLYGDTTDFTQTIMVGIGSTLQIAGNYFHPGSITFLWDKTATIGTALANETGFFNTTVTIPTTTAEPHTITVKDSNIDFLIKVNVSPGLSLNMEKGPAGTLITATGYGFPHAGSPTGNTYSVTLTWNGDTTNVIATTTTDATGKFTATFTAPQDYGGTHTVTAVANGTATITSSAPFIITPTLTITPFSFSNNPIQSVTATGTGFDPNLTYIIHLDNALLPLGTNGAITVNATGNLLLSFVNTGLRPGIHTLSLYQTGMSVSSISTTFTVTDTGDTIAELIKLLNGKIIAIEGNIATIITDNGIIKTDTASIKAAITDIKDDIATIQTTLGTLQISLSSINPTITSIQNDIETIKTAIPNTNPTLAGLEGKIATIQTTLGVLNGTIISINEKVATIQTDVGTIKVTLENPRTTNDSNIQSQITTPLWVAVAFSFIAAIVCIIILIRQQSYSYWK